MKTAKLLNTLMLALMIVALVAMPGLFPGAAKAQGGQSTTYNVFASASRGTTTVTGFDISGANATVLQAQLDVTANTGTNPTLDVVISDGPTKSGPWSALLTFTQVTSTANSVLLTTRAPLPFLKVVGTVGGTSTPKFTYTLWVQGINASLASITSTLGGAVAGSSLQIGPGANGTIGQITIGTELLTLSTSGATTDTSANLLPAGSLILSVNAIVTTTITTATDWKLGDPTSAGRFSAADSTLTAGERVVGIVQWSGAISTLALGPSQASAAKIRVTTTGTPGAGVIRITVIALTFTAPTS